MAPHLYASVYSHGQQSVCVCVYMCISDELKDAINAELSGSVEAWNQTMLAV